MYNQSEILEAILQCFPRSNQISNIDISHDPKGVYFTWRNDRYKVEVSSGSVYRATGSCLESNSTTILASHLMESVLPKIAKGSRHDYY